MKLSKCINNSYKQFMINDDLKMSKLLSIFINYTSKIYICIYCLGQLNNAILTMCYFFVIMKKCIMWISLVNTATSSAKKRSQKLNNYCLFLIRLKKANLTIVKNSHNFYYQIDVSKQFLSVNGVLFFETWLKEI